MKADAASPAVPPPGSAGERRRAAGAVASGLATLGGGARFPVASGTAGSLATLPLWWLAQWGGGPWGSVALGALLSLAGIWAAGRVCRDSGVGDPSEVVVDEAAGMLLSLAFLPPTWGYVAAAFLLFRALDVIKPWPAGAAERLPGGLGVVADDLVSAAYTNLLLRLAAAWLLT